MSIFSRLLIGLAFVLAARPAMGDGPPMMRANGQSIYPAGVSDPAMANPPGPSADAVVPLPPIPGPLSGPLPGPAFGPMQPAQPIWTPNGPMGMVAAPPGEVGGGIPAAVPPASESVERLSSIVEPPQAGWYGRVEYMHWNERIAGADFVNEGGALFTLGYTRQSGIERYRAELFGGDVHYDGYGQFGSGAVETLASNTGYLGLRGEYELVIPPAAEFRGTSEWLVGLGSRFWVRDLHDGTTDQGTPVWGYQETWWTMYPYLGIQTHRPLSNDWVLYTESRAGTTALTYQFVSINERPLWPGVGVLGNVEVGLRGQRFFISGRGEVMSWTASSTVQGAYQPQSIMWTAGGRMGFTF